MGKAKSKGKKGEYEMSADAKRIIPLKENYCYIFDEKGKTHHLKRDSEEALELMKKLNDLTFGRVAKELENLGWKEQLEVVNV